MSKIQTAVACAIVGFFVFAFYSAVDLAKQHGIERAGKIIGYTNGRSVSEFTYQGHTYLTFGAAQIIHAEHCSCKETRVVTDICTNVIITTYRP